MATINNKRPRSASNSNRSGSRPLSRASTTSMNSGGEGSPPPAKRIAPYTFDQHDPERRIQQALLSAAHGTPSNDMHFEQSMQSQSHMPEHFTAINQHIAPYNEQQQGYNNMGGQVMHHGSQQDIAAMSAPTELDAEGKKKGGSANSTNDKELREMLAANEHRTLQEVAHEVTANERTSRAERTKQLFAMLWLKKFCRPGKTSVPRSRVYGNYADTCGSERVTTLNPASFGKLVRVIFPGIQTRRLGVRGESKYHYVDLELIDGNVRRALPPELMYAHRTRNDSISTQIDFNNVAELTADTAVFPTHEQHLEQPANASHLACSSKGSLFTDAQIPGFSQRDQSSAMHEHTLKFPPPDYDQVLDSDTLELPDIMPYIPPKTDPDIAENLRALYRSHCISLVDCIRFCKEKQFFRLFTTFHGTLTVPVQQLFANPALAPWVKECDWLMYQKMIRFVSQLTLQVAPPIVLKFLDTISKRLYDHISKVFQKHAPHVLAAKLEPATLFAHLLHRMIRVNQTAHAAAALLMIDQNRDQMWQDWVSFVNPKRIMESELPNCGYEEVYRILTYDIGALLQPLSQGSMWLENAAHYHEVAMHAYTSGQSQSNDSVIDRLASFLVNLPSRFPGVSTRTLLQCISTIGTAALREITVENGASYGSWWITKVFIDEMSLWLASLGGFLDHKAPAPTAPMYFRQDGISTPVENGMNGVNMGSRSGSNSEAPSRYSSLGAEYHESNGTYVMNGNNNGNGVHVGERPMSQPQPQMSTGMTQEQMNRYHELHRSISIPTNFGDDHTNGGHEEMGHDDSGIGLGIDEGFGDKMAQLQRYSNATLEASVS